MLHQQSIGLYGRKEITLSKHKTPDLVEETGVSRGTGLVEARSAANNRSVFRFIDDFIRLDPRHHLA